MYGYCNKCHHTKLAKHFHKNRSRKTGLHDQCKLCMKIYNKKYRKIHPRPKRIRNFDTCNKIMEACE